MGGTPLARRLTGSQAFWVFIAILLISTVMTITEGEVFFTEQNFFNITRNFSFTAIMALGQTAVIITGGIDLGVGSVMGLAGIVLGLMMSDYHLGFGLSALLALLAAAAAGLVNGLLIAGLGLSPFVVTLGMLSIGRSLALAISNNKFFYQFGPGQHTLLELGGGQSLGIANSVWILILLTLVMAFALRYTAWGRHVYAIGGNEQAARLTGVRVDLIKVSVYVLSSVMAGIAAILTVGWQGSVTNALGLTYELKVIASSVIGGVNLMGGEGGAIGTFVGSALIELIRNSLILAGVDPYWQGTFVGLFIIFAVLLERIRGRKNN
ncbi:MAG: ABC transporter permease [Rhodospirillaceae bacterium]|nr:ABC transporter permease [Rhodospirillaceae bacterium]